MINSSNKTANKFFTLANSMQATIDHKLDNNRLTNTPKRLLEAGYARQDGEHLKRTQSAMIALAIQHELGSVPALLAGLKSKKMIHDLMKSRIERNGNYYNAGQDTGEPLHADNDTAKALWAMVGFKSPEEKKADKIRELVNDLQFASIPGYFPTQPETIDKMFDLADIRPNQMVLEPQAGSGAIADRVREKHPNSTIHCYETQHSLRHILTLKGHELKGEDFLQDDPFLQYDRVVMNPPFEKMQDINHVMHAYNCVKKGGVLVAIMSPGPFQNSLEKARSFRHWFEKNNGEKIDLPAGSFKASGTMVNTVMIRMEK